MAFQQKRHVARPELGLLPDEGSAAGMHDERIVREHVAPSCARGAQAQVVLLAITRAEDRVEDAHRVEHRAAQEEAEADAGRDIGVRRARPPPQSPQRRRRDRARSGHGLSSQKRGNEQISALFENGVIVPIVASVAAQCRSASSQPRVTIVSELSRTTSERDSCMPRLAVPVKPRLTSLRSSSTCGCAKPLEFGEVRRDGRIGRCVVDQHQAHVGPQMREHARHAGADIGRRVVHRHHHVGGVERHCAGHSPRRRCHQSRTRSQGSENHQRALCR